MGPIRPTGLMAPISFIGSGSIRMALEFIDPKNLPKWPESFSQVVIVPAGNFKTVYLSGQVAMDKDQNLIGPGDLAKQALKTFENLSEALAASGAGPRDVVKLNIYVKDYQRDNAAPISEALRKYFPDTPLPTSTWLGVQSLALDGLLIEVDAIAVVPAD